MVFLIAICAISLDEPEAAMKRYPNKQHASGVSHYASDTRSITVMFHDGTTYRYDERKPGRRHVDAMKKLAQAGSGLATYINRHVRGAFAARVDGRVKPVLWGDARELLVNRHGTLRRIFPRILLSAGTAFGA